MLAYRQTIDNEVNKSWIARIIRTQTVSLNLEFGIAAKLNENLRLLTLSFDSSHGADNDTALKPGSGDELDRIRRL
jgi:hypothetical protein